MFGDCSVFVRVLFGACSAILGFGSLHRELLMDDKLQDILDNLPEKPPRSRLEPYSELIRELRRRRRTYREIAEILAAKCNLRAAASTIHDFVRVRSRATRKPEKRRPTAGPGVRLEGMEPSARAVHAAEEKKQPMAEVHQRIAALKKRAVPAQANPEQFQYDPSEPLRLPEKTRRV